LATTTADEMRRSAFLLLSCVATLLALGVVMVWSASAVVAAERDGLSPLRPLIAHGAKVAVGIALLLLVSRIDPATLRRLAVPAIAVALVLLALVLVPGVGVLSNGSRRWLATQRWLGFALQPSEFAKLGLIVFLAAWVARPQDLGASFRRSFLPAALAVLATGALILLETDFGTFLLVSALGIVLLLVSGARIVHLLLVGALALPPAALFLLANPRTQYVFDRLGRFFEEKAGAAAAGGALTQVDFAESALRVGGLTGAGIGAGRHQLFFLSEAENDFILAVVGEELGFVGTTAVVLLTVLALWAGWRILLGVRHRFGFVVVAGVLITIAYQALMNLFVAVRLVPVKGVPLPFVSSGGSSLTTLCVGVGLVLAMARRPAASGEELGPEPGPEDEVETSGDRGLVAEGVSA
jgi:cell division protein FtsW